MSTVLAAIDGSPISRSVLDVAREVSRVLDARLDPLRDALGDAASGSGGGGVADQHTRSGVHDTDAGTRRTGVGRARGHGSQDRTSPGRSGVRVPGAAREPAEPGS